MVNVKNCGSGLLNLVHILTPSNINDSLLEVVSIAKILGLTITHDLKWNELVSGVIKKARKRLYFLSQLKRSHLDTRELYPILCYLCQTYNRVCVPSVSRQFNQSIYRTTYIINHLSIYLKQCSRSS